MKQYKLGLSNLYVSQIGIGALPLGPRQLDLSVERATEILEYAFNRGINFLDTAEYYDAYEPIKRAVNNFNKKEIIISCKSLNADYQSMKESIENSLDKMGLSKIHIYLLHEVVSMNDFKIRSNAWKALLEAKAKGLIDCIGISTHFTDVAFSMASIKECDVVFPLINFCGLGIRTNRDGKNISGSRENMEKSISALIAHDKGVYTMKTFGGGTLIKEYNKALSYSLGLNLPTVLGFSNEKEIDAAIDFSNGTLNKNYSPILDNKKIRIEYGSCIGCMACAKRCPNMAIYDSKSKLNPEQSTPAIDYNKCMSCGYCTPVCPVRALIYI